MNERPSYTPFDQLSDDELVEAMVMHIRMGYTLLHPGKGKDSDAIARDIVSRLTLEQINEIHPHTFFANKKMGTVPVNPYQMAKELLGDE
jgi:hypothetical protein